MNVLKGDLIKIKQHPISTSPYSDSSWCDNGMDKYKGQCVIVDDVFSDGTFIIKGENYMFHTTYIDNNLGNSIEFLNYKLQTYQEGKYVMDVFNNNKIVKLDSRPAYKIDLFGIVEGIFSSDICLWNAQSLYIAFVIDKFDLFNEIKIHYPIGTQFRVVHKPTIILEVTSHDIDEDTFIENGGLYVNLFAEHIEGDKDDDCDGGAVYFNGKWAEIVKYNENNSEWKYKGNILSLTPTKDNFSIINKKYVIINVSENDIIEKRYEIGDIVECIEDFDLVPMVKVLRKSKNQEESIAMYQLADLPTENDSSEIKDLILKDDFYVSNSMIICGDWNENNELLIMYNENNINFSKKEIKKIYNHLHKLLFQKYN